MEAMLAEMPLTIFTTLVPLASGAFAYFALSLCAQGGVQDARKFGKSALVPLIITGAAFIAAFFHLAGPLNAPWVLAGIGRSPMSNEIVGGVVFALLALGAVAAAFTGRGGAKALRILCVLAAVSGLVFSLLVGLAYYVPTVPTWHTLCMPVGSVGAYLAAGMLLGRASCAEDFPVARTGAPLVCLVAGAIAVAGSYGWWAVDAMGMATPFASGSALVGGILPILVTGIALVVGSALAAAFRWKGQPSRAFLWATAGLFAIGFFLLRICFYQLYMTVGL